MKNYGLRLRVVVVLQVLSKFLLSYCNSSVREINDLLGHRKGEGIHEIFVRSRHFRLDPLTTHSRVSSFDRKKRLVFRGK